MSTPDQSIDPIDPLDSLLDFSQYDDVYQPPSLSPTIAVKSQLAARPASILSMPSLPSSASPSSVLSGPSHRYELFKQQTPFAPGAVATTLAVTQMPHGGFGPTMGTNEDFDFLDLNPVDAGFFDFDSSPPIHADIDMDYHPQPDASFLFSDVGTINPSAIEQVSSVSMASVMSPALTVGSVGRLWPGAHSQAALAKAQAQTHALAQRQPQKHMHAQAHNYQQIEALTVPALISAPPSIASSSAPAAHLPSDHSSITLPKPKAKVSHVTNLVTEQKISQLFNSMRSKSASDDGQSEATNMSPSRFKKDDEDMDDDERLLASAEGKKLTSKERRQLRNKVSARAFRSRRKEYITQLEAELSSKVTENGVLRSQNRDLMEENGRLSDLSRLLLSSPAFSDFLNTLTTKVAQQTGQPSSIKTESVQQQPQQPQRQLPKDVNPNVAAQQANQHLVGVAMMPQSTVDFSALAHDQDATASLYQPQVFTMFRTSDVPLEIDLSFLSGKTVDLCGGCSVECDDKVDMPVIDHSISTPEPALADSDHCTNDPFDSDPEFILYHREATTTNSSSSSSSSSSPSPTELEVKWLAKWIEKSIDGVDASNILQASVLADNLPDEEAVSCLAMARVERISRRLDKLTARIKRSLDS